MVVLPRMFNWLARLTQSAPDNIEIILAPPPLYLSGLKLN